VTTPSREPVGHEYVQTHKTPTLLFVDAFPTPCPRCCRRWFRFDDSDGLCRRMRRIELRRVTI
jgi:hypothetical protein